MGNMRIGIQISSDLRKRTGVEEYAYQLIKHLAMLKDSKKHRFFFYSRENLKWPFKWGWTQIRLSWELLRHKIDILFVPAHTLPLIHPKFVVTVQGLEYERVPEMYSFFYRKILRFLTKRNTKRAEKIIVPSESTKNDLINFYKINPDKIFVIYHGVSQNKKLKIKNKKHELKTKKYILYLGSGHRRKNINGLIEAFKILKEKYKIPHKLILAGPNIGPYVGSPTSNIRPNIMTNITSVGYVNGDRKWQLLRNAEVFIFPSFYEGFGFPVLEAQIVGVPVVASDTSSLPEILESSALLVNPEKPEEIAKAVYKIIKDKKLRDELIKKGYENVKRFSWQKCAQDTLNIITS